MLPFTHLTRCVGRKLNISSRFYRSRSLRPLSPLSHLEEAKQSPVLPAKRVPDFACPSHSLESDFFVFGSSNFGQLGAGSLGVVGLPSPIPALEKEPIGRMFFASMCPHSFAVSDDGLRIWSWGFNQAGQLGLGHRDQVSTPTIVKALNGLRIIDVFPGPVSTFVVAENLRTGKQHTYHFGSGFGDQSTPLKKFTTHATLPMKLANGYLKDDANLKKIAAASTYALFLDDKGKVYSFGDSELGALGHGQSLGGKVSKTSLHYPELVPDLEDVPVIDIAVGWETSMVLTADRKLYAWGDNQYGQCGFGLKTSSYYHPRKLTFFNDIDVEQISCGAEHALALDTNGHVYCWGRSADGRLGSGAEADVLYPQKIDMFDDHKIIKVVAGYGHSTALDENGTLWVWGSGAGGQLSQLSEGKDAYLPFKLPPPQFGSRPESVFRDASEAEEGVYVGDEFIPVGVYHDLVYEHKVVDVSLAPTITCFNLQSSLRSDSQERINEYLNLKSSDEEQ